MLCKVGSVSTALLAGVALLNGHVAAQQQDSAAALSASVSKFQAAMESLRSSVTATPTSRDIVPEEDSEPPNAQSDDDAEGNMVPEKRFVEVTKTDTVTSINIQSVDNLQGRDASGDASTEPADGTYNPAFNTPDFQYSEMAPSMSAAALALSLSKFSESNSESALSTAIKPNPGSVELDYPTMDEAGYKYNAEVDEAQNDAHHLVARKKGHKGSAPKAKPPPHGANAATTSKAGLAAGLKGAMNKAFSGHSSSKVAGPSGHGKVSSMHSSIHAAPSSIHGSSHAVSSSVHGSSHATAAPSSHGSAASGSSCKTKATATQCAVICPQSAAHSGSVPAAHSGTAALNDKRDPAAAASTHITSSKCSTTCSVTTGCGVKPTTTTEGSGGGASCPRNVSFDIDDFGGENMPTWAVSSYATGSGAAQATHAASGATAGSGAHATHAASSHGSGAGGHATHAAASGGSAAA